MENGKVNLAAKLRQFQDHWKPRTVAQLNNHDVMVVKVQGEFVWHKHDDSGVSINPTPSARPASC